MTIQVNFKYIFSLFLRNYQLICSYLTFEPHKPGQEDIQTLYSWLSERTIDDLFSQWATYCEIFHTRKTMGLLSDGLNNVNVRYKNVQHQNLKKEIIIRA